MKKKSAPQSAFFKLRVLVAVLLCFAAITLVLFAFGKASAQPRPPAPNQQPLIRAQYRGVMPVVKFDISPPLRTIKPLLPKGCTLRENEEEGPIPLGPVGRVVRDPVVQRVLGKIGIPAPLISFDGNSNLCGCSPPDPNGAVGPNNVVTMANLHFQIFDKSGNSLFGPAANNTLWAGFGGPCQTENAGDPVVLYDQLADRWILTQFTAGGPTFFECVAVSQTNDPTGSYFRYAISTGSNFPDYPKAGVWPDAYYFSTREFLPNNNFAGVGAYALDRAQALVGNPNPTIVGFLAPPTPAYVVGDGLLPSTLDGQTPPPVGSPNFFVGSQDDNGPYGAPSDGLTFWKFHYDPVTPGNSTFAMTTTLPTQAFNSILGLCGGSRNCIPQPNTANRIDHLGYRQRPLFRLAYRNFGDHESLVTNQSVSAGTGPNGEVSGVRWWELRDPNGATPVIFQEGTYAPGLTDGVHRWMGSIAMNSLGDIALGFSASNGTNPSVFPGVLYTARHDGDPPGQMTLGEGSIKDGTGSQTGSQRWGDYTALVPDPTDDITFWYINEYVPTTSAIGWRLRIGAFNLTTGPTPSPSPTPTATPTGCSWSAGPDLPSVGTRFAGVFFPANGKFYAMGGRNSDNPGTEFTHPFEYDPGTNAWTIKSATYPDIQVNNIACGVLNESGTDYIYCAGGSDVASQTTTGRVFRYDPVTDTISTIGDPWPPGAATTTLPGGFTVFNNNLFILGGFDIPGGNAITDIWEFDPSTNAWEQKGATLPVPLGYIPTTTIGNLIYTGGGSDITGGILTDTTNSFVYDPVADSISTIAAIPRATGETRALNFNGQMYVMGGGRTAPNPSNEVDIYDPGTDTWSTGIPFVNGRRNFATDTDGTTNIWLVGGYDVTGVPTASMEIFNCPQVSPTPTPTATPTPTPPTSPTPTPTVTPPPTPRPTPTPRPRPTPHPRP
jgi:hypothetical protein